MEGVSWQLCELELRDRLVCEVHFLSDPISLYVNILDWPEAVLASLTHLTEVEIPQLGSRVSYSAR